MLSQGQHTLLLTVPQNPLGIAQGFLWSAIVLCPWGRKSVEIHGFGKKETET